MPEPAATEEIVVRRPYLPQKERCPHILKPAKGMGYAAVCSGKKPGSFASDVVTILLDFVLR